MIAEWVKRHSTGGDHPGCAASGRCHVERLEADNARLLRHLRERHGCTPMAVVGDGITDDTDAAQWNLDHYGTVVRPRMTDPDAPLIPLRCEFPGCSQSTDGQHRPHFDQTATSHPIQPPRCADCGEVRDATRHIPDYLLGSVMHHRFRAPFAHRPEEGGPR